MSTRVAKLSKRTVGIVLTLFLTSFSAWFVLRPQEDQRRAERLVNYFNGYLAKTGNLPSASEVDSFIKSFVPLNELERGPFYEMNENSFRVWYGTTLGSSRVYRSTKGGWSDEG